MAKRAATKTEKEFMRRVAALGCIICKRPCELHHPTGAGWGLRHSHYDVIPLCAEHHRIGNLGVAIHAGTKTWEKKFGTQAELIKKRDLLLGE